MPSSVTAPEGQLSRRDKFRAYMQASNPTAPALQMIEAGLVCEELHHYLFRNLAGRADLEPGSQQLLVGGVGSGKTTELILAERWLANQGHVLPLYVDTSAETDLSSLNSGALLASFGLHLGRWLSNGAGTHIETEELKRSTKESYEKVKRYAYGKNELVLKDEDALRIENVVNQAWDVLGPRFSVQKVPGKLKPPLPPLNRDVQEVRAALEGLLAATKEVHKDVVFVFDGLDRLLDPTKFWSVVHQDLRVLRELKVSVIATAPLSVLFGAGVGQSISDHFDRVHHLAVIATDPENALLRSVLEKRRSAELLNGLLTDSICHYSGGVLRDLISLARDAAEEAYVSERDSITATDIEKVAHQLGTGYLRGLGPEALNALLHLESSKSFDLSQPSNVELLITRRVLEYSSTDFRVHPALLSVIPRPEPKRA